MSAQPVNVHSAIHPVEALHLDGGALAGLLQAHGGGAEAGLPDAPQLMGAIGAFRRSSHALRERTIVYTLLVMKKAAADRYRDIDFSRARRGAVVKPEPGKTKISIRLDKTVLDHFRDQVDKARGGNYQTLINAALLEHIHRRSALDIVRQVLREELASSSPRQGPASPARGRVSRTPRGR